MARLKAYWEAEHAAAQREQEKRHQAVLNRWTKLVQGLRIRQRMREQYGGGTKVSGTLGVGDVGSSPAVASGYGDHDGCDDEGGVEPATAGGFLTGVEDVIQLYSLLRPTHVVFSSPPRSPNSNGSSPPQAIAGPVPVPGTLTPSSSSLAVANDDDNEGIDETGEERARQVPPTLPVEDVEELEIDNMSGLKLEGTQSQSTQRVRCMPKSMATLAAEAEARAQATTNADVSVTPHISEEGEEGAPTASLASRSSHFTVRATPRTRPNTKIELQSRTRTRTKTKTTAGTLGPSRKKRARTQDDNDDDDEAVAASGLGGSGLGSESAPGHLGTFPTR